MVTCNILMSYATSVVEDAVGNSKSQGALTVTGGLPTVITSSKHPSLPTTLQKRVQAKNEFS